jgi:hypothetical protein
LTCGKLYYTTGTVNQIMDNETGRACSINGKRGDVYRILVGKPTKKTAFNRPRHRWEHNIKTGLTEIN